MSRTSSDGKRSGNAKPQPVSSKPPRGGQAAEVFGRFLSNLSRLESGGGTRKDGGRKR